MRVWGVIATILFLAASGASGWLYFENTNLKKDISSAESQKEEETSKIDKALSQVDILGYFAETYLEAKQSPDEMTELAKKITDIGDRNLEVAYGDLQKAAEDEQTAALQSFLAEFTRVITETLGGEVDHRSESPTSQSQTPQEENQQIEGEGEYSDNVFP